MKILFNTILLAGLCSAATGRALNCGAPAADGAETRHAENDTVKHQPMTESDIKLSEVVVTSFAGNQNVVQSPAPVTIITQRQMEAQPSANIIDAVAKQPGVAQVTTGSGISKPVIRGLGYNRVLVVSDGVRQEGQQWGDEHGVEIDQHSVRSVEIIKGPASLRYGSDAMAGAIVFRNAATPPEGVTRANVTAGYQTNNGLFDYSLNLQGNRKGFVWNTLYSGKMAHDYKNSIDGYVGGSRYKEQSLSQMLGLNRNWGFSHLLLSYYHLTPGIVEGEEQGGKSYSKTVPYQQIHHYKAVSENLVRIGGGVLKAVLGYQMNHRQEFEEKDDPEACGLDLALHTVTYDARYDIDRDGGWTFSAGVNGMYQSSLNRGTEFLIPNYHLFDCGVFAMGSLQRGRWSVSAGLRYDWRRLHSKGMAAVDDGAAEPLSADFCRNFNGVSGSAGATYTIAEGWHVKLNISRGFRAPNISELGSDGIHEGAQLYQKGNSGLKPENSWQADLGMDYSSDVVYAQVSLFANRIGNYIFSSRMADGDGNPAIIDDMPVYRYTQGNARIMGGEVAVDVHPTRRLHIGNAFSYVSSTLLHQPAETKYLPFTPAPRWNVDVKYELVCGGRTFDNMFVKAAAECNLRQNHYYAANNTETATPSYTLFHLYAGTDILCHGKRMMSVYLAGENLFDRAYQSHLSRLKYLGHNPVTGREGVYNMGRNFSVKVVVPIRFGE